MCGKGLHEYPNKASVWRTLKWAKRRASLPENAVRKGQKVGEELKDMTLKYFGNTQRTHFLASYGLTFSYLSPHSAIPLSLRCWSLCLADSPHTAPRKQTAPVLLLWAWLGKSFLFLTRFMCCLQRNTAAFLLKFLLLHFPFGRNPHGFVTFSGVI